MEGFAIWHTYITNEAYIVYLLAQGFSYQYILDSILASVHSNHIGKKVLYFRSSWIRHFFLILNTSYPVLLFLGLLSNMLDIFASFPIDKLLEIQKLALSLFHV